MTGAGRLRAAVYRSVEEHLHIDGGASGLLAALPADSARALIHILDCPTCQDMALVESFEAVERGEDTPGPDLGGEETAALLTELLAIPKGKQAGAVKDKRYHRMDLLDRLLDEAARAGDLTRVVDLAALAVWLGSEASDAASARPRLLRAFCLDASARRLAGKLTAADTTLDSASHFLTGDAREVGLYSRTLALLRWEQGRWYDAAALLRYGAHAYGESKRREEQGVCLILLGLMYVEAGEMRKAPWPLVRGLMSLGECPTCRLAVTASLSMAVALAHLGWPAEAREAREQAWVFFASTKGADKTEAVWLDGRVAAALGEAGAGRLLDTARVELLAGGRIADGALASLDLAALYCETRQLEKIGRLIEDLEKAGAGRPEAEAGAGALRDFAESKPSKSNAWAKAGVASVYLRRTFRIRFPGIQTIPWT